jgi:hypothetical protein
MPHKIKITGIERYTNVVITIYGIFSKPNIFRKGPIRNSAQRNLTIYQKVTVLHILIFISRFFKNSVEFWTEKW